MKKTLSLLAICSCLIFASCTTQRPPQGPLIKENKKEIQGSYCEVLVPPEEVKVDIVPANATAKNPGETKTYYFFLGHKTMHLFVPYSFDAPDEWYLVISEDKKTLEDLRKMTPQQTAILAVAEIPPLTEFYESLWMLLPEPMKSRVQALNTYKIYRCFGYAVVDRPYYKDPLPVQQQQQSGEQKKQGTETKILMK